MNRDDVAHGIRFLWGILLAGLILVFMVGCQGPDEYHERLNQAQPCDPAPRFATACTNNPGCSICLDGQLTAIEVPELGCTFERAEVPGRNLCVHSCDQCEVVVQ